MRQNETDNLAREAGDVHDCIQGSNAEASLLCGVLPGLGVQDKPCRGFVIARVILAKRG